MTELVVLTRIRNQKRFLYEYLSRCPIPCISEIRGRSASALINSGIFFRETGHDLNVLLAFGACNGSKRGIIFVYG